MTGEPAVLVLLLALLALGSWGWGRAAVAVLTRAGWTRAAVVVNAPLQLVLGMALFLSVGGFMVALGLAYFGALIAWHVAGAALLAPAVPAAVHRVRASGLATRMTAVAAGLVSVFLLALAFGEAIGMKLYNGVDDDAAYIYLAKRLLATGGLSDPFSLRRITSYGGGELYQAMFLQATGNSSLRAAELIFAAGVVLILVVAHAPRRWPAAGAFVIGVPLILGRGEGPVANLSPNFSVAALSLAVLLLLRHVATSDRKERIFLAVVIGVMLAGILALREYFLVSVAIAVVVVLVVVGSRGWRDLGVMAATGVVASVGWAVALWRSSGTPLFPLFGGNYNQGWPSGNDPTLQGVAAWWHRFLLTFDGNGIGWVAVIAVGVGGVSWICGWRPPVQMLVLCAAGVGCLLEMAALSYTFSGSVPNDVVRFVAPSTLACGLLTIDALWPGPRLAGASPSTPMAAAGPGGPEGVTLLGRVRRLLGAPLVSAAVALAVAAMLFGSSLPTFASQTGNRLQRAVHVVNGSAPMADRYRASEAEYRTVNGLIPQGATVFAAVDLPGLLDMNRFRFSTLDFAGAVSPPPHLPFVEGPGPTVAYLRHLGYDYIVSQSPGTSGMYYYPLYIRDLRLQVYFEREDAPFYFAWEATVSALETSGRYPVHRAGALTLIDIGGHRGPGPAG